jgi:hypothetical protein
MGSPPKLAEILRPRKIASDSRCASPGCWRHFCRRLIKRDVLDEPIQRHVHSQRHRPHLENPRVGDRSLLEVSHRADREPRLLGQGLLRERRFLSSQPERSG